MTEKKFKGYFMVNPSNLKWNDAEDPQRWSFLDCLTEGRYSGFLDLTFKLSQPFSVTDGIERVKNGKIFLKMHRVGDHLLIPGSSLKGAVRTYFEALCGFEMAGRVFGNEKRASMVYFSDVLLHIGQVKIAEKEYPEQFAGGSKKPKQSAERSNELQKIRLYTERPSNEYKKKELLLEVIENGQFRTRVIFRNMTPRLLLAFLTSLGALSISKDLYLKVGRGKNVGFGLVKIDLSCAGSLSAGQTLSYASLDLETLKPNLEELRKDLQKKIEEIVRGTRGGG